MKTGIDVRDRAFTLLNYTDQNGKLDHTLYADVSARSLALINQIYAELWYALCPCGFAELPSLSDEIALPERVLNDCMAFGVAMLMAQTIGDADNQSRMTDLYNQKRAVLSHPCRRKDVLPREV